MKPIEWKGSSYADLCAFRKTGMMLGISWARLAGEERRLEADAVDRTGVREFAFMSNQASSV
jgi:hypothetical protein